MTNKKDHRQYMAAYYAKNKDKIAAQNAAYRAKNRDKINAKVAAYCAKKVKAEFKKEIKNIEYGVYQV